MIGRPITRDLVENTPKIGIKALREAGGLLAGAATVWRLEGTGAPLSMVVRAEPVPAPSRIFLEIGGRKDAVPVRIDRQPRHYGREHIYFLCPGACGKRRYDLFIIGGRQLQCRVCANLAYRAYRLPHKRQAVLRRAVRLRRRFGGHLFGPPPPRPLWVRRDFHAKWVEELRAWEARALQVREATDGSS